MTSFYLFSIFIFGLIIGSFLNAFIYRLHEGKTMMGRSFCPKCFKTIHWYDNIPVFSFLFLKGSCRHCKKKISWQYPLVEIVTALIFVVALYVELGKFNLFQGQLINLDFEFIITLFRDLFLISILIIVFVYDLRWYIIRDEVVLPATVLIFILNLFLGVVWWKMLFYGIIGLSFFLVQFWVSKGRWVGGGDIFLGLLIGIALPWPGFLVAIMLSYFIGSFVGLGLIVFGKKKMESQIPFGPFLVLGTIATLFFEEGLVDFYLKLFT